MKKNQKRLAVAVGMLVTFILWTVLVSIVDVKAVGPMESSVGFSGINSFVHNLIGEHMWLYDITDWLSIIPLVVVMGFGVLGLVQAVVRKSIVKVDYNILVLGGFYVVVMAVFVLFELIVINYRPVLIEGVLEASYPSSTTMLVMCVMPTAIMQFNSRIKNKAFRKGVAFVLSAFTVFMVIGRLISGVHWFTDIVGGAFLSAGLVLTYSYFVSLRR